MLLQSLRNCGCKVGDHFTVILVYGDDIVLLALWCPGLQLIIMVGICSSYAGEHNLLFSTNLIPSKSKGKSANITYCLAPTSFQVNVAGGCKRHEE